MPQTGDMFTLAVGDPAMKRRLVEKLRVRDARFATVIHPSACTSTTTKFGEGVTVGAYSGPGVDTVIGDFVTLNSYSGVGHDTHIGSFTTISGQVDITACVLAKAFSSVQTLQYFRAFALETGPK